MKQALIQFAHELERQDDAANDLWTWLPSYKAAQKAHGDYSCNHRPSVSDIIKEATIFISHGLNPTEQQRKEAGEYYECPCGELHMEVEPT